jgi:hypothetical protein
MVYECGETAMASRKCEGCYIVRYGDDEWPAASSKARRVSRFKTRAEVRLGREARLSLEDRVPDVLVGYQHKICPSCFFVMSK